VSRAAPDVLRPIAARVLAPLWWRARGDVRLAHLADVERLLDLDGPAREAHRLARLRALLGHARATVPFYEERLRAAGVRPEHLTELAALRALPPLTKRDLAGRAADLRSRRFPLDTLVEARTGGTTSRPVPFLQERRASLRKEAATIALRRRMGWPRGVRTAWLWGALQDAPDRPRRLRGRLRRAVVDGLVERALFLPATELSPARLDDYAERLRRHRPHVLQGYPAATDLLARRLIERGETLAVPLVVLTAEPVLLAQRERIQQALGGEVLSFYGARECGWIASECRTAHRLHLNTAGVHLEAEPDGRLLVTDLENHAMPLLRYEIGDRGALDDAPCPCGDPRPVLARLEGRVSDVLTLRSGRRVPGVVVDFRNYRIGMGLLDAQLVQEDLDHLRVRYVPGPGFGPGSLEEVRRWLDSIFQGELSITFERRDAIPAEPNGKVRHCLSKVSSP
jgi:phenylacetate-coenzyme A ligase PaaK-like adenylate-forming protein